MPLRAGKSVFRSVPHAREAGYKFEKQKFKVTSVWNTTARKEEDAIVMEPRPLMVPPLRSGGVMLTYQCNQSCRHCSYRSRPGAGEWMTDELLEKALDLLAGERRLIDIHLAGGEPTLNPELLLKAIRMALAKGLRLSYVETNGFFADTPDKARSMLAPLKEAGLNAVLVSVSPYHNEFLPLRHTLNCLEAAADIFGQDGVFPWLGHFLPMLSRLDAAERHSLAEFLEANGMEWGDAELLRLFPISPVGRAPEGLRDFFGVHPAETYRGGHCLEMLSEVSHFHIDPYGNVFTGHCPGIVAGTVDRLHEEKTPDRNPVFTALSLGGPFALAALAYDACGFRMDDSGYASPCDLCFQARKALFDHDAAAWPELGPAVFYA